MLMLHKMRFGLASKTRTLKKNITVLKDIEDEVMELIVKEEYDCASDELERLIEKGDRVRSDLYEIVHKSKKIYKTNPQIQVPNSPVSSIYEHNITSNQGEGACVETGKITEIGFV